MTTAPIITNISEQQMNQLRQLAVQWHALEMSTEPADHELAELALRSWDAKYARVLWFRSPLGVSLANGFLCLMHESRDSAHLSFPFWNALRERVGEQVFDDIRYAFQSLPGNASTLLDYFERTICGAPSNAPAHGGGDWPYARIGAGYFFFNDYTWGELWWGYDSAIAPEVAIDVAEQLGATNAQGLLSVVHDLKRIQTLPGCTFGTMFPFAEQTQVTLISLFEEIKSSLPEEEETSARLANLMINRLSQPSLVDRVSYSILSNCCFELFSQDVPESQLSPMKGEQQMWQLLRYLPWFFQPLTQGCLASERPVSLTEAEARYADGFTVDRAKR